jgi:predicted MFS family arabinose efflux permease
LLAVTASVTIGFGAIFALLPEFQDKLGFADFWLGAVTASSFVAGFVAQAGLARYADRGYGRHLLVAGIAVAALGAVGVAVAQSVEVLLIARVLLGLGEGAFLPAARRVVILRNPDHVGAALGRMGSAAMAGFVSGPPIAALIAERFGLRAPFWAVAVLLVALLPVTARFAVPPTNEQAAPAPLRTLISIRGVRAGLLLGAGLYLAIGVYDSLWAKFLQDDHGTSTNFVAWSLVVFAMPMLLLAPRMGGLSDRIGPVRLGSFCTLVSVPFVAAYGFLPNAWLIGAFAFVHSCFDSAVTPSSQSAVARSSPPALVAAGQGLLDGFGLLVAAASALVFASVYSTFGDAVLWCSLAVGVGLAGFGANIVGRDVFQNTRSTLSASQSL